MKTLYTLLGLLLFVGALLVDPFAIAVMIFVLWGHTNMIMPWIVVGGCLYLWFTSKHNKPFSTWKPSTMKAFWRNWNEIAS